MAKSPVAILYDSSGNPVGVVLDGAIYRLQTSTDVAKWIGSTAPTVGQKAMASSLPIAVASDQSVIPAHGAITHDSVDSGNPLKVGGKATLGLPVRVASGDRVDGWYDLHGAQVVQAEELPTFSYGVAAATSSAGGDASLLSIVNTHASKIVRIKELSIVNHRTASATGVAMTFTINRITGHSGGTALTAGQYDTTDALDAAITGRTGATVSGEVNPALDGRIWSTDEWGPGTLDQEGFDHGLQSLLPWIAGRDPHRKRITLRQNEGLHIKAVTASGTGIFGVQLDFTVEG